MPPFYFIFDFNRSLAPYSDMTESRVSILEIEQIVDIIKKKQLILFLQHNSLVRFLPTYRLEPKNPFNTEKCENILKLTLDAAFDEFEYTAEAAEAMALKLSQTIMAQVKKLNFDR